MKKEKLIEAILSLSNDKTNWENAKKEWILYETFIERNNCLCGQNIMENCIILNVENNNQAIVGNSCVNNFLEIETKTHFNTIKKLAKKDRGYFQVDPEFLELSFSNHNITKWEYDFYYDLYNWKRISEKQSRVLENINDKLYKLSYRLLKGDNII